VTVSDRAQASKALRGKAGRPPEAEGNVGNANIKASDNNADYLTARIARDRPDILERMKGGEYASVRQAALEAGIVRKRVSIAPTVEGSVGAMRKYLATDEIAAVVANLAKRESCAT
jgi:hypothetical protein